MFPVESVNVTTLGFCYKLGNLESKPWFEKGPTAPSN